MEKQFPYAFADIEKEVEKKLIEGGYPERVDNWCMRQGGADSGRTFERNYAAYDSLGFRQCLIHGDKQPSLQKILLGKQLEMPLATAPMAVAVNIACPNGFVETAKAAQAAGVLCGIGYPSGNVSSADVIAECANSFRVVKPLKDEVALVAGLKASEKAGCLAVGMDLDAMVGLKTGDVQPHFADITKPYSLDMIREIRKEVSCPFMLKGVMSARDAEAAAKAGANAIVVSTHAGYGLDSCQAPLEVLGDIRKAVGKSMEIYVDSGIRRGVDMLKPLALGADGVFIGRLVIWGLMLGGSEGVVWILNRMKDEALRTMNMMGIGSPDELDTSCLVALNELGDRILR